MDQRKAASVLPEPVGATTRADSPRLTAAQAPTCASVGAAKAPSNHAVVAGENGASGSDRAGIRPVSLAAPTCRARCLPPGCQNVTWRWQRQLLTARLVEARAGFKAG